MTTDRRTILAGGAAFAAAAALPAAPRTAAAQTGAAQTGAAQTAERRFSLLFGGGRIGGQTVSVTRSGASLEVRVDIDIGVEVFGLTMYRYSLGARETWTDGRLVALEARTNDNGTARSMAGRREPDGVAIAGTGFTGRVTGNPVPQSYWTPAFLRSGVWISLEDGRPRRVAARDLGPATVPAGPGEIRATRWRVEGEIDPIDLFYDEAGEWVGSEFRARGATARFVLASRGASLGALWSAG